MKVVWPTGLLLLVLCLTLVRCSQDGSSTGNPPAKLSDDSTPLLLPVKVAGKWGYVNSSGQMVINPQFDNAEEFREGRAAVCLGKTCTWWDSVCPTWWHSVSPNESRWGFIDTSGKLVVTPQYGCASGFSEGLASVCTGDCGSKPTQSFSRGYIDRDGKVIIPMQFGIAGSFSEGLAQVCIGKCQWEQGSGYDGKFGFIDHSGHFVINPQYDDANDFKSGFARITIGKGNEAKSGYIDKTGKTVWQPSN